MSLDILFPPSSVIMTHCIRKSICDSPLLSCIHQYFLRNFDNLLQYLSYVPLGHDMTPIFSIVRKHLLFTLRNIQFFFLKKENFAARIYCYIRSDHESNCFPKLTTKWDKVLNSEPSKTCGRQALKN